MASVFRGFLHLIDDQGLAGSSALAYAILSPCRLRYERIPAPLNGSFRLVPAYTRRNAPAHRPLVCHRAGGLSVRPADSISGVCGGFKRRAVLLQREERQLLPEVAWARGTWRPLRTSVCLARVLRAVPGFGPRQPARRGERQSDDGPCRTGACGCVTCYADVLDSFRPARCSFI
jgi:hypothetical protein